MESNQVSPLVQQIVDENIPSLLRDALNALDDDTRLAILVILAKEGEAPIGRVAECLGIFKANVANHLKKLELSNLVMRIAKKKENEEHVSYYKITEFGDSLLLNISNTFEIKKREDKIEPDAGKEHDE